MTESTPRSLLTVHPLTRRSLWTLAAIVLVATVMRMGDALNMGDYSYDQGALALLAMDMAAGKSVPLTGIESSAGIPNSPVTVYLLAIPYLFTDNPQTVTLMIAAFNVFGVALLWLMAHRYLGSTVALVAGLAYAVQPYAVHYSRSIWAQDYHTPLILLGLLMALMGFLERRRWAQAASLPVLFIAFQVHYAAWTLLPAYLWIVWWGRRQISWAALTGSVALAVMTLMPFAAGLAQASGEAAETAGDVADRLDSLVLRNKAALYAARLATGLGGPWVGTPLIGEYSFVVAFPYPLTVLWLLPGIGVITGLFVAWVQRNRFWAVLLGLWAVLPFIVFLPNWTGVFSHYFIPNLPALALLVGLSLAWLLDRLQRRPPARWAVVGIFGLMLVMQAFEYLDWLEEADATVESMHATPIHYLMDVRAALEPYNDVVIVGGRSGDSGYEIWRGLLYNRAECVRELVIASGGLAVFPNHPYAVLTPQEADPTAAQAGDVVTTVALRPDEGAYTIGGFERAPAWDGPPLVSTGPYRFANGAALTGYHLDENLVYLEWYLDAADRLDYQYFVHFLNADGERVGQRDASFWPGRYWCNGDRLVTWIDANIPEEVSALRVGFYRVENGQFVNSPLLNNEGGEFAPWADVGLNQP